jgi:hypothetical protein
MGGIWEPENHVLLSNFSEIEAVAASPWLVFAATTHGLLIYDRITRRFRRPVTSIDGYPQGRVRRALADPAGNAVWLDVEPTGYIRYDADGKTWTPGELTSVQASGILTVEAALARTPLADAMRAAILTDPRLRIHQFTSAAATPDRPEIFFGTNGLGIVRVDKQTGEWEVLSYGLLAPAVGAIALSTDGVWAGTDARPGERRGLTWIARDLSSTRTSEGGGAALGFSFLYCHRLLTIGDQLWLATEQGVLRIDSATFRSRLWDLPQATALARAPRGVWVGTTRGLSLITADDQVETFGPNAVPPAVLSLLAVADTLWVGTSLGLGQLLPGTEQLVAVPGVHEPVYALTRAEDTIVMATERALWWRDPVAKSWTTVALPPSLGRPTALAFDPRPGLWIGGTRGLGQVDLGRAVVQVHTVPYEMPAAVRDLAADRDYVWAATDSGLVRIQ